MRSSVTRDNELPVCRPPTCMEAQRYGARRHAHRPDHGGSAPRLRHGRAASCARAALMEFEAAIEPHRRGLAGALLPNVGVSPRRRRPRAGDHAAERGGAYTTYDPETGLDPHLAVPDSPRTRCLKRAREPEAPAAAIRRRPRCSTTRRRRSSPAFEVPWLQPAARGIRPASAAERRPAPIGVSSPRSSCSPPRQRGGRSSCARVARRARRRTVADLLGNDRPRASTAPCSEQRARLSEVGPSTRNAPGRARRPSSAPVVNRFVARVGAGLTSAGLTAPVGRRTGRARDAADVELVPTVRTYVGRVSCDGCSGRAARSGGPCRSGRTARAGFAAYASGRAPQRAESSP